VNGIVAVGFYSGMPDLQQELSIPGELEYLASPVSIAGQPDVVFVVNRDAMLAAPGTPVAIGPLLIRARGAFCIGGMQPSTVRPLVFAGLGRPTPALNVVALLIELNDRRRGLVPVVHRVPILDRMRALEHPNVSVGISVHTA